MKCHEAQTALGAEPRNHDAQLLAHVESCAACADYRARMLRMDDLILKALTIPIETPAAAASSGGKHGFGGWQVAASLLASVAIAGSIWIASTQETLAEQLIEHADHEA